MASAGVSTSSTSAVYAYDSLNQRVYKAAYNASTSTYSNEQIIL